MGYAIRRADATYRCWNACTQDDVLRTGEVWEALAVAPVITPDPLSDADKTAAATIGVDDAKLKAVVRAIFDEIDGRHPATPVDRAAFRLRAIAYLKALLT